MPLAGVGRQALEMLGRHPAVDLFLLEIVMPMVGGAEAFTKRRWARPELTYY